MTLTPRGRCAAEALQCVARVAVAAAASSALIASLLGSIHLALWIGPVTPLTSLFLLTAVTAAVMLVAYLRRLWLDARRRRIAAEHADDIARELYFAPARIISPDDLAAAPHNPLRAPRRPLTDVELVKLLGKNIRGIDLDAVLADQFTDVADPSHRAAQRRRAS